MNTVIQQLIDISQFYGKNSDFVIAGGGNTSYKDEKHIWVKASGINMCDISENGFAVLERDKLKIIAEKQYSHNSDERESQIKADLFRASAFPEKGLRPSVETSLHNLIGFKFVVHTHPTIVNALMCSQNAAKLTKEIFGSDVLFIPYTDPGYVLFKYIEKSLVEFREINQCEPNVIYLENHGVFVAADTVEEIRSIYDNMMFLLQSKIEKLADLSNLPIDNKIVSILPAIRAMLTEDNPKTLIIRHHGLVKHFYSNNESFTKISLPFSPDIIVYCKSRAIYVEKTNNPEVAVIEFKQKLDEYKRKYGYAPKIIVLKDLGFVAVEDNYQSAEIALDVFEDLMKISLMSENFGGPKFLNEKEISFIDNWEVENYRRQISKGKNSDSRVSNKIIIVTGGAQGFGAGIAEDLINQKANVVIADLNEVKGQEMADELNSKAFKNRAVFIKADVSDAKSVQNLITETVKAFGGLDVFISNAGILRAGGINEMSPETFELMTKINYSGYFLCVKYAAEIMKLQAKHNPQYFSDIIQINSKSGLKGSNKNFAYAGGKFGGIGLTQSFALELMPFKIKVNAVCPGNFFDGPLWSDPEKGLFVQYLNANKVAGAKTINDVKAYYEKQVPAGRGCEVTDVMRAIYYIIDQEYETGQAVPVTGGQEMLK